MQRKMSANSASQKENVRAGTEARDTIDEHQVQRGVKQQIEEAERSH